MDVTKLLDEIYGNKNESDMVNANLARLERTSPTTRRKVIVGS